MFCKFLNRANIFWLSLIICIYNPIFSQNLRVISKVNEFREMVAADSLNGMKELKALIPEIVYDLRYATTNNFTGKKLYTQAKKTYLRLPVTLALQKVQEALRIRGFGLKVFDAYRPYSATVKMWELIKDERYVADPAKGSGHNRGLAIDLTIINLQTGEELNMGTGFDNFTDTAHQTFTSLPEEILQNRILLKTIMEKNGFTPLETEWWHYYWPNDRKYDVLDIDFKKLK